MIDEKDIFCYLVWEIPALVETHRRVLDIHTSSSLVATENARMIRMAEAKHGKNMRFTWIFHQTYHWKTTKWVWVNTYRYILVGWTSIYQLFWGSRTVPGFWPIPKYLKSTMKTVGFSIVPRCDSLPMLPTKLDLASWLRWGYLVIAFWWDIGLDLKMLG